MWDGVLYLSELSEARQLELSWEDVIFDPAKHARGADGKFAGGTSAAVKRYTANDGMYRELSPADAVQVEAHLRNKAKSSTKVLYRGEASDQVPKRGQTISKTWASASEEMEHAQAYAENDSSKHPVVYVLPKGTQSTDVSQMAETPESEHLFGGNFKVDSVSKDADGTHVVKLRHHEAPWHPSASYGDALRKHLI